MQYVFWPAGTTLTSTATGCGAVLCCCCCVLPHLLQCPQRMLSPGTKAARLSAAAPGCIWYSPPTAGLPDARASPACPTSWSQHSADACSVELSTRVRCHRLLLARHSCCALLNHADGKIATEYGSSHGKASRRIYARVCSAYYGVIAMHIMAIIGVHLHWMHGTRDHLL